MTALHIFRLPM